MAQTPQAYRVNTVAPKKLRRVDCLRGELNRLILNALRKGEDKSLTNVEIAAAIVTAKGYGEEAMPALIRRIRANLSYLLRNHRVTKAGNRMTARWSLAGNDEAAN
jgi:hypothetical protein